MNILAKLIEESIRTKLHPYNLEVARKYPNLWANDNIQRALLVRYPSTRMTDEEYRQHWTDLLTGPSLFESESIQRLRRWSGGTVVIPLEYSEGEEE